MIFGNLLKAHDLFAAAKRGDAKAIEELVATGHDVNGKKRGFVREGFTPLHIAVLHEQKEAIKKLAKLGADINGKNNDRETPLWTAVTELKSPGIAELLLDLEARIDARSGLGMSALDLAAFDGKLEMVKALLNRGANPNAARGSNRSAPIQQCAHNGNLEVLELLLKSGAEVNAPHCGSHALGTAAVSGHADFVRMLLEAGAAPNQSEESGTTPLMCSVAGGKLEIVKMIAEAGANLNAVRFRAKPETALDFAEDLKKTRIAEYLRSLGAKRAAELPASETTPPPEEETGADWQLGDDSILEATLEPWPPKPGPAKLKVEISPNGHDRNLCFSGALEPGRRIQNLGSQ
jgi:ankyrin repeat protein